MNVNESKRAQADYLSLYKDQEASLAAGAKFIEEVGKLREKLGIANVICCAIVPFGDIAPGGSQAASAHGKAWGNPDTAAEMAAHLYANHAIPVLQRAERLAQIASGMPAVVPTPQQTAPEADAADAAPDVVVDEATTTAADPVEAQAAAQA